MIYLEKLNEKTVYNFFKEVYETFEEKEFDSYGDEMSFVILQIVKYYNNNDFTRLFDMAQDYINNWLEISLQDIKDIFENYDGYAREALHNIHKEREYYVDSEGFYHHNILSAICAEYKRILIQVCVEYSN
jgi:hypothetical protein